MLERLARERDVSEAELLRQAVTELVRGAEAPAPRLRLFRGRGRSIAEDVDSHLREFGIR